MPIDLQCGACSKRLRLPDNTLGKKCKCPGCGNLLKIEIEPSGSSSKPTPNDTVRKAPVSTSKIHFQCPNCKQMFAGKEGMQGRRGKCSNCGEVFSIELKTANDALPPEAAASNVGLFSPPFESNDLPFDSNDIPSEDPFSNLNLGFESSVPESTNQYWQTTNLEANQKKKPDPKLNVATDSKKSITWIIGIGSAIGLLVVIAGTTLWMAFGTSRSKSDSPIQTPQIALSSVGRRESEAVGEAIAKLTRIRIAFHNFESAFKYLAPSVGTPNAEQLKFPQVSQLSWRVHLLPFLGLGDLHKEFKQDEPWDSPHNIALLDRIPDVYQLKGTTGSSTCIQVAQGPTMLFGRKSQARFSDLVDGVGNTILVMTVGKDKAVPWTCPVDFAFDPAAPVASMGTLSDDVFVAATVDESRPIVLGSNVENRKLLALLTPNGGEVVYPVNTERESMEADGLKSTEIEAVIAKLDRYLKAENELAESKHRERMSTVKPAFDKKNKDRSQTVQSATEKPSDDLIALQKIATAFRAHQTQFTSLPQPWSPDAPGGKLSWRVHLLPYIGQLDLYLKFHLNEAWDSEHNLTLLERIPDLYKTGQGTKTSLCSFFGDRAVIGNPYVSRLNHFMDGPENTILAMSVPGSMAKPWTQPNDLAIQDIPTILDGLKNASAQCVLCDGKTIRLPIAVANQHLKSLATALGGEKVNIAELATQYGVAIPVDESFNKIASDMLDLEAKRQKALKNIAVGIFSYESAYKRFPITNQEQYFDKDKKPFLSWRVHLLPFLDEQTLYQEFKLTEPWDSPANAKLMHKMPPLFRDPTDLTTAPKTRYQTFTGKETGYSSQFGPKSNEIRSAANTLSMCVAGENKAVIWTQPIDLEFDPTNPFECLGDLQSHAFVVAKFDGATMSVKTTLPANLFAELVNPTGNKKVPDWATSFGLPVLGK